MVVDSSDFRYAYGAWFLALVATLASLFLSQVMELPPCSLCWFQRICLFPLVLVIAVGIVLRDPRLFSYSMPLVVTGLGISLYHNLLYYGVIPEGLSPCKMGVPCSERQLELLGFVGIPLMSFGTFVAILACLVWHRKHTAPSGSSPP